MFERYDLPLLADEYFYIYSDLFGTHQRQDMVQLTKQVIESVSKELNYPFVNDANYLRTCLHTCPYVLQRNIYLLMNTIRFLKKSKENTQRYF